jgi:hypothetical protein
VNFSNRAWCLSKRRLGETFVSFVAEARKFLTKEISLKGLPNFSSWKRLSEEQKGLSVEWLNFFLLTNQVPAFKTLGYE